MHSSPAYRPDIDGLRALAVSSVLVYHFFPSLLPGGFIGVDVFFVISGYLITSGLLLDEARDRKSLVAFYGRRIRRIFPALVVTLAVAILLGWLFFLPNEFRRLGAHVLAAAAFLSNIVLWRESGYFDSAAFDKPLLHLWSLSIEEQFYAAWPVVLWGLIRFGKYRFLLVALMAITSFGLCVIMTELRPVPAFYLPITRFWELLAGGLLALWQRQAPIDRIRAADSAWPATLSGTAGLVLISISLVLFRANQPFPGWRAVLPVLGAVLIISSSNVNGLANALLSSRPAVLVGLISYPLYLIHWVLLAFAHVRYGGQIPLSVRLTLVAASVGFAVAIYRYIERPLRFGMHPSMSVAACGGSIAVLAIVGAASYQGIIARTPSDAIARIDAAMAERVFVPTPSMNVRREDQILIAEIGPSPQVEAAERLGTLLMSGDSQLFHWAPRVEELFQQGRLVRKVVFVVGASCAPVPGTIKTGYFRYCQKMPAVLERTVRDENAKDVALGASWVGYNGVHVLRRGATFEVSSVEGFKAFYANLEEMVAAFAAEDRRVHLILSSPTSSQFSPSRLVRRTWLGLRHSFERALIDVMPTERDADLALAGVAKRTGAELLDPVEAVCGHRTTCAPVAPDGEIKYVDNMHLRAAFVAKSIHFLDGLLISPARP